jgi:hypothetical protein
MTRIICVIHGNPNLVCCQSNKLYHAKPKTN